MRNFRNILRNEPETTSFPGLFQLENGKKPWKRSLKRILFSAKNWQKNKNIQLGSENIVLK